MRPYAPFAPAKHGGHRPPASESPDNATLRVFAKKKSACVRNMQG